MNDLMTRMRMKDLKQDLMVVNELKIVINSWLNPKYGFKWLIFYGAETFLSPRVYIFEKLYGVKYS